MLVILAGCVCEVFVAKSCILYLFVDVTCARVFSATLLTPPSRTLPQRSWAAAVPTLLSHDALDRLVTPGVLPGAARIAANLMCPLERFLSCVAMRKFMYRSVHADEIAVSSVQYPRGGAGTVTSP